MLTGETGAGKTLLVEGLLCVAGARIRPRWQPSGAAAAEVDRAAVIDQITDQLAIHIRRGARRARIQLRPAELGAIQVDLRVGRDGVRARLTVEHEAVAQAIRHSSGELRAAFEGARLPVSGLDVQLAGGDAQGAPWSGGQPAQPQLGGDGGERRHDAEHPGTRRMAAREAEPVQPPAGVAAPVRRTRLDLTV